MDWLLQKNRPPPPPAMAARDNINSTAAHDDASNASETLIPGTVSQPQLDKRKAEDHLEAEIVERKALRKQMVEEEMGRIQRNQVARYEEVEARLSGCDGLTTDQRELKMLGVKHNQLMSRGASGPHLLNLPAAVQRRIFAYVIVGDRLEYPSPYQLDANGKLVAKQSNRYEIRDDRSLVSSGQIKSDGTPIRSPPGLLTVCHQIREMATPIFLVGNSFVLNVQNFDASPHEKFHEKHLLELESVDGRSIKLCDVTIPPAYRGGSTYSGHLDPQKKKQNIVTQFSKLGRTNMNRNFAILYRPGSNAYTELQPGGALLNVSYDSHWPNLMRWLRLYHQDRLPALTMDLLTRTPANIQDKLLQISYLFTTVDEYQGAQWDDIKKSLECQRRLLAHDDEQWNDDHMQEAQANASAVPLPDDHLDAYEDLHQKVALDDDGDAINKVDDDVEDHHSLGLLQDVSLSGSNSSHPSTPAALEDLGAVSPAYQTADESSSPAAQVAQPPSQSCLQVHSALRGARTSRTEIHDHVGSPAEPHRPLKDLVSGDFPGALTTDDVQDAQPDHISSSQPPTSSSSPLSSDQTMGRTPQSKRRHLPWKTSAPTPNDARPHKQTALTGKKTEVDVKRKSTPKGSGGKFIDRFETISDSEDESLLKRAGAKKQAPTINGSISPLRAQKKKLGKQKRAPSGPGADGGVGHSGKREDIQAIQAADADSDVDFDKL